MIFRDWNLEEFFALFFVGLGVPTSHHSSNKPVPSTLRPNNALFGKFETKPICHIDVLTQTYNTYTTISIWLQPAHPIHSDLQDTGEEPFFLSPLIRMQKTMASFCSPYFLRIICLARLERITTYARTPPTTTKS